MFKNLVIFKKKKNFLCLINACLIVKFIMVRVGNKSNQSQFFPGLTANTKKPGADFIKIKTFLDSGEC